MPVPGEFMEGKYNYSINRLQLISLVRVIAGEVPPAELVK